MEDTNIWFAAVLSAAIILLDSLEIFVFEGFFYHLKAYNFIWKMG